MEKMNELVHQILLFFVPLVAGRVFRHNFHVNVPIIGALIIISEFIFVKPETEKFGGICKNLDVGSFNDDGQLWMSSWSGSSKRANLMVIPGGWVQLLLDWTSESEGDDGKGGIEREVCTNWREMAAFSYLKFSFLLLPQYRLHNPPLHPPLSSEEYPLSGLKTAKIA